MVLVHSVSDVDVVLKSGINVIKGMFNTSVGLGLGTGLGYLIMGYRNSSEYAQQVEEDWERRKLELEESEANLERLQKNSELSIATDDQGENQCNNMD
ncbi:hypothetical protein F2Q70_00023955 [Brassica cretica]|uniref:Uncharacterized protein n=1 Tax=Brassica cretica TaxID=69181 RepID=A0A8S9GHJ5_BRACR|nr:hypothetical protein F2Q70_00023955 [Brassica cretica]KAF2554962.1 hypothetical protein F2Q68_00018247 [Brassica cretica]